MKDINIKSCSYYFVHMHLRQTVAFPQEDRKFPISALTQPTVENTDCCIQCESAFSETVACVLGICKLQFLLYIVKGLLRSRLNVLYFLRPSKCYLNSCLHNEKTFAQNIDLFHLHPPAASLFLPLANVIQYIITMLS